MTIHSNNTELDLKALHRLETVSPLRTAALNIIKYSFGFNRKMDTQ